MMQPIVFKVALFRGDWDQARSQLSLLWMLESLCRVDQTHIRQFRHMQQDGQIPTAYPPLYRSGGHYEREKGTEEWLDIVHMLDPALNSPGGPEYAPGPWWDCEDGACYRVAEWRELPWHYRGMGRDGKPMLADPRLMPCYEQIGSRFHKVSGGVPAKPFAKWRQREDGSFAYHALLVLPDGRLEDPSLVLGMTWEDEFHRLGLAQKYKDGTAVPRIRFSDAPDVMVIDPEKRSGYGNSPNLAKRLTGLTTLNGDAMSYEALAKSETAAFGFDAKDESHFAWLGSEPSALGFREGPLGRIGVVGRPDSNWAARFNFITQSTPSFVKR